jgi:hypothetical protein
MQIDIFKLEYLQFIFSGFYTYIGFLFILLIVTYTIKKVMTPVRDFFMSVRKRVKDYDKKEKVWEEIKKAQPEITKPKQ